MKLVAFKFRSPRAFNTANFTLATGKEISEHINHRYRSWQPSVAFLASSYLGTPPSWLLGCFLETICWPQGAPVTTIPLSIIHHTSNNVVTGKAQSRSLRSRWRNTPVCSFIALWNISLPFPMLGKLDDNVVTKMSMPYHFHAKMQE